MSASQDGAEARGARTISPSSSGDPSDAPRTPSTGLSPDVQPTLSPQQTGSWNLSAGPWGVNLEPRCYRLGSVNVTPAPIPPSNINFPPSPDDIDHIVRGVEAYGDDKSNNPMPSRSQGRRAGTVLGRDRLDDSSGQDPISFADCLPASSSSRGKLESCWNQQADVSAANVSLANLYPRSSQQLKASPGNTQPYSNRQSASGLATKPSQYSGQQIDAVITNRLVYSPASIPLFSNGQAKKDSTANGTSSLATKLPLHLNEQAIKESTANGLPFSAAKLSPHSNQRADVLSSSNRRADFTSTHDTSAPPLKQLVLLSPWQKADFATQYRDELLWTTSGSRGRANDTAEMLDEKGTRGAFSRRWQVPSQPLAASATSLNSAVNLYEAQCQQQSSLHEHPFLSVQARMGEQRNTHPLKGLPVSPITHARQPFIPPIRSQGFLPMQAIRSGREFNLAPQPPATVGQFSVRYHGMHTECNASAEHLRPEENASLWITNLPPDVTTHELLGQIRNVGRIWASYINGPDGTKHSTAAAKIVFFSPVSAQRLLQLSLVQGFRVRGYHAKVTQNRIKTPETHPRHGNDSRVLIVTGHQSFVNQTTLTAYFEQKFEFQLDEVKELLSGGGRAVVEFKFGSYRCQSQMGKMSLEMDKPGGFEKAEFGEDPCEVGETFTSMEIALQRIRGIGI